MRIRRWAVAVAAVVVTTGCSDAPESESSEQTSAEPSATAESSAPDDSEQTETSQLPGQVEKAIVARMTAMDGLFGEPPAEQPEVLTPEVFNAGAPESQVTSLAERGFQAGAYQNLVVPDTSDAIRVVMRFETAKGAEADVASGADDLPGEAVTKKFAVPGVPGALGFDVYGQTGLVGRNIAFSVGQYEYLLGFAAEAPPSKQQATRDEMAGVAADWYERVADLD